MGKVNIRATITDKKGRILSAAQNSYSRTHPIQARFASRTSKPNRIFLHAEIAALVKLRSGDKPHKIFVERYFKDGKPALARPCPVCEAAIKHYGIKTVEYTL